MNAIYIHIPFCKRKCGYCDFHVFVNMQKEYTRYVDHLIKEISLYPEYYYDTIYFGGGTPSVLDVSDIKRILSVLKYDDNTEITLEMNPTDIPFDKLCELREAGVNRLSIGFQSFNDNILKFMDRTHTVSDAIATYMDARSAGFDDISIDIIFSVPNQSIEDVAYDLKCIKDINPDHISIYSLIWEEGTAFYRNLINGKVKALDEDIEADMYELIINELTNQGYEHYEISSFAKDKKYGRHNLKYWENKEFIGVGVKASSYYEGQRYDKIKMLRKYYAKIDENIIPIDERTIEIVDKIESLKLSNMLGLRMLSIGVKKENIPLDILKRLINKGYIYEDDGMIKLSRRGMLLANEVFVEFV